MTELSLGYFVRLVIAASRPGGRIQALRDVALLPEEEGSLRGRLVQIRNNEWDELTIEQRETWGALYLYAFARCCSTNHLDAALLGPPLAPEHVEALAAGRDMWTRRDVVGAPIELETLLAAAQAIPAPIPPQVQAARSTARSVRVHVRPMPPGVGRYAFAVRAEGRAPEDVVCTVIALDEDVAIALMIGDQPHPNQFRLAPDGAWQRVAFTPSATRAIRARIELRPCAGSPSFRIVRLPGVFPTIVRPKAPKVLEDGADGASADRFFAQLETHGAVSEEEAVRIFGSPRAFRRFSLEFEGHLPKLPFSVRIEIGDGGKRYVREGDR